ncbi:MAG: hypothetical protein ACTSYX_04355 [Candidatus Thorarchaeota archaeon]
MGYHHKKSPCAKETREILRNVLQAREAEYELIGAAATIRVSSPMEKIIQSETDANVLTSDAERILAEADAEVSTVEMQETSVSIEDGAGTEYYKSVLEVKFKLRKAQEAYKKKRRHSNSLDIEIDYSSV